MNELRNTFRFFRHFRHDAHGSVLLVAAVCFMVLIAVGGAGYDFGRRELVRLKLQQALDASALAGALLPMGTPEAERRAEVMRFYKLNFPAMYQQVKRPDSPSITITDRVEVRANLSMPTSFIENLGIPVLPVKARSVVIIGNNQADLDVVLIIDESASNRGRCDDCGDLPRIIKLREAAGVLADTIYNGTTNPNVRMGMLGYSGTIINKWGLTADPMQAKEAINAIGMVNSNYEHFVLRAAYNMITGKTDPSVASGRQASALCGVDNPPSLDRFLTDLRFDRNVLRDHGIRWNWPPCPANENSRVPPPRSTRSDRNPVSKVKNVILETDGFIMYEPPPCIIDPRTGLQTNPGPECPNYAAFLAECSRLKADGVTVFTVSYVSQNVGDTTALTQCASIDPVTGKAHYYHAPTSAALKSIFRNIGVTIRKVRIAE